MAWGGDDDKRPEGDEEEELDETVSSIHPTLVDIADRFLGLQNPKRRRFVCH
jgi:hypothetical protein